MNNTMNKESEYHDDFLERKLQEKNELQAYSIAIKGLAENKSPLPYANKNHKHASVVISTIFDHTQNDIVFYEDGFNGNISDNNDIQCLEKSLVSFLSRGGKLTMVLRETSENISQFGKKVKSLKELRPEQLIVKKSTEEFEKYIKDKKGDIFFIVGDKKMYRIEDNIKDAQNNRIGSAYGSFNQPKTAEELYAIFMEKLAPCKDYFDIINNS